MDKKGLSRGLSSPEMLNLLAREIWMVIVEKVPPIRTEPNLVSFGIGLHPIVPALEVVGVYHQVFCATADE